MLFRNESGSDSESQITAFEDTWHWNLAAEETYHELPPNLQTFKQAGKVSSETKDQGMLGFE